jgi:hypothetical protein
MISSGDTHCHPTVQWAFCMLHTNSFLLRRHLYNLKLDLKTSDFFCTWWGEWFLGKVTTDLVMKIYFHYLIKYVMFYKAKNFKVQETFWVINMKVNMISFIFLFFTLISFNCRESLMNQRSRSHFECGVEYDALIIR